MNEAQLRCQKVYKFQHKMNKIKKETETQKEEDENKSEFSIFDWHL